MDWADTDVHGVYVQRVRSRRRCLSCPKAARKRVTHNLMSNGLCMADGCEWHVYQMQRKSTPPKDRP